MTATLREENGMGNEKKRPGDGRSAFRGHDAPKVAGGRRLVATYLEEGDYLGLRALAEKRGKSLSSVVAAAVMTAVKRAR
jgi:hypothetical protein